MKSNLESRAVAKHKIFDWREWMPCMIGMIEYNRNEKKQRMTGLYAQDPLSALNVIHIIYQALTTFELINYLSGKF